MTYLLHSSLIYIPYVLTLTLFFTLVIPAADIRLIRVVALLSSLFVLFVGLVACISFDKGATGFQFINKLTTIGQYNLTFALGADGLSVIFLLLTLLIFPVLFLAAWNVALEPKKFVNLLLAIEILLVLTFTTTDILYFFILFESLLIPMFIMIGVWGARDRKIKAAYYFFLYTLFGSLFMLFGIFYLYTLTGSTAYEVIMNSKLLPEDQTVIWFCFFMAFAIKMPLFPFHIWLPEAHVEAPTTGSMLLASLLLKLGGYGFLRFSLTCLSDASYTYSALVYTVCALGVFLGALATMRQIDLKRIIAYSSVSHMNLAMIGLFTNSSQGVDGAIYLMVAHGVVSTALFFCIGVLYDRHHSRLLRYYGGVALVMPVFAAMFLSFNLANMGFPGTANFPGELAVFQGVFNRNIFVAILASTAIVLGAIYSVWLYNRVSFGALKVKYIDEFTDLVRREFHVLAILLLWMLILGIATGFTVEVFRHATLSITHDFSFGHSAGDGSGPRLIWEEALRQADHLSPENPLLTPQEQCDLIAKEHADALKKLWIEACKNNPHWYTPAQLAEQAAYEATQEAAQQAAKAAARKANLSSALPFPQSDRLQPPIIRIATSK